MQFLTTSHGHWLLGRVQEVFPEIDGHVCVVKVQVGQDTIKLAPAEFSNKNVTLPDSTAKGGGEYLEKRD